MYCSYFGFHERPFTLTPNPAFIFLSRAHQEAFAHLIYGIENRSGFIMLTGEVGAGKTTVIRTLLSELKPETYATALILNPMVSTLGLLSTINREFGISDKGSEPAELVEELYRFLLLQKQAGRTSVLVIDEAQDMEPTVLEQVRLVSNLETSTEKLIQIILVGQPELETLMGRTDLRQLNQRITVRFHLTPMELSDTADYIRHRIKTAADGNETAVVFTGAAVKYIHNFAGGLPRLINASADRSLLIAFNHNLKEIDASTAKKGIRDVSSSSKCHQVKWKKLLWISLSVLFLFVIAVCYTYPVSEIFSKTTKADTVKISSVLPTVSETENIRVVLSALEGIWDMTIPSSSALSLEKQLYNAGFKLYGYTGNLGGIIRLGYPAIMKCVFEPDSSIRYLLLSGISRNQVILLVGKGTTLKMDTSEFEKKWTGSALVPWKNFSGIPVPLRHNSTPGERNMLIRLMLTADVWPNGTAEASDAALRSAIKSFQSSYGIETTGIAGELTLMKLYRVSKKYKIPSLERGEQ